MTKDRAELRDYKLDKLWIVDRLPAGARHHPPPHAILPLWDVYKGL